MKFADTTDTIGAKLATKAAALLMNGTITTTIPPHTSEAEVQKAKVDIKKYA